MTVRLLPLAIFGAGAVASLAAAPSPAQLTVVSVSPGPHRIDASPTAPIVVRFDRPVDRGTIVARRSFWAFGKWSGTVAGGFRFSNGDRNVEIRHNNRPFSAGEMVTVFLSRDVRGADGSSLRDAGYSFQFWVAAQPAALVFEELERHSVRSNPALGIRSYGGIGTDLDGDGHLDVTVVNEDSDDLRIFINRGDGSGRFDDFRRPPSAAGDRPSPSEPSDFDRDGRADVAVANFGGGASILRGLGDGRFAPQQLVLSTGEARGIAVLDADGDGDVDVVHTTKTPNLALLLNDGAGGFGTARLFPGAGTAEWALAAADMTGDGILDLVTGDQSTRRIYVHAGNGDGTFRLAGAQASGGETWMLVLGDLDGDRNADVAAVNGASDTAAILLGTGNGNLRPPRIFQNGEFPLATDLGDLDGDGDLDWLTSSFFGFWRLYENDGRGGFALYDEIAATDAASCALLLDVDNDRFLDLALIDELEDELIVMRNAGGATAATLAVVKDRDGGGRVRSVPAGIDCGGTCVAEFDLGTEVTLTAEPDGGSLFAGWSGGGCSGRGECRVTVDGDVTLTASFALPVDCAVDDATLCLNGGRFRARVTWSDFEGVSGAGRRVLYGSDDSGLMWFFEADNWEMLIKVLDGCGFNQRYWVFSAATTNVAYTLEVLDAATGVLREYANPLGVRAAAVTDVEAFDTCP